MITTTRYCYLDGLCEEFWYLDADCQMKIPELSYQGVLKARVLDTYGQPLNKLCLIGDQGKLLACEEQVQNTFFSASAPWHLNRVVFGMDNHYHDGDFTMWFETDNIDPDDETVDEYDQKTGKCRTWIWIRESIKVLFELDRKDGTPVERYVAKIQKTPNPKVDFDYEDLDWDDPRRRIPSHIYTCTVNEYIGTRNIRMTEVRSDNYGKPTDNGLYAKITEYL